MAITTLNNDIKIKKSFKDISDNNWDKIILVCRPRTVVFSQPDVYFRNKYFLKSLYYMDFLDICVSDSGLNGKLVRLPDEYEAALFRSGGMRFPIIASQEALQDIWDTFPGAREHFLAVDTVKWRAEATTFMHKRDFEYFFHTSGSGTNLENSSFRYVHYNGKGCCKMKNEQIFKFLKKYAGDGEISKIEVTYPKGMQVEESEVGLPVTNPTPTPVTPTPVTNPSTGGTTGPGGLSAISGSWTPGESWTSNSRVMEAQSSEFISPSEKSTFTLIGLISSVIIIIAAKII